MKGKRAKSGLTSWFSVDVTDRVLCASRTVLGLPYALADIVNLSMPDPSKFSCPESFRTAYWRAEMWSKFPFSIEGLDRKAAAMQSFWEYELRCADANRRLTDVFSRPIPEQYRRWLAEAKRLLHFLFEGFTLDEFVNFCTWGPGASTSMRRSQASPQNKWVFGAHITEACLPLFYAFSSWSGRIFTRPVVVEGNKVVTVAKNAKTDRTIAIEPDWNCFFQLGLGGCIRRRLQKRFGLLRPDAQQVNQILAREGSRTGTYATIDLKGASDGISLALVEELFPPDVVNLLLMIRSPTGDFEGRKVVYEKISSMGNGSTFELETALFYCLVRACSGYAVCYGDDIITMASTYQQTVDFLTFCGFVVNEKKSHYDSPFRESCGGHYFHGVPVTPPYVRRPLKAAKRISFGNQLSKCCDNGHWRSSEFMPIWSATIDGIPRKLEGPSYVDGCVHVDTPFRLERKRSLFTFTGVRVVEEAPRRSADPLGSLLCSLWNAIPTLDYGVYSKEKSSTITVPRLSSWVGPWQGVSPWAYHVCDPP